jgi:EAL domain-containing protein (putative c-di-GMP-specific phosphodiesterase class I)
LTVLKLIGLLMRDVTSQSGSEAVVRSIVSLAQNLGLDCVAEEVETMEQLDYLQSCDVPKFRDSYTVRLYRHRTAPHSYDQGNLVSSSCKA